MNTFELLAQTQQIPEYEEKIILRKIVSIPFRNIVIAAYLYMVIPILIFFLMWLKWYIGIPMAGMIVFALYHLVKREYTDSHALVLPLRTLVLGVFSLAIFLWLTGQGGFFFQYSDNHWRNALFFDLVEYDWPLIYPQTQNALVYYFLHWLIPALVGKATSSIIAARIALYFWTLTGVVLVVFLLAVVLNANTKRKFALLVFIFFVWSGINIIGGMISNIFGLIDFDLNTFGWWTNFTLDGQGYAYMFRSNCDQLASVYNQTIAPWLAIALLVNKPKPSTFVFLAACVFAYSPLPFIGIAAIMIFYFLCELIHCKKKKDILVLVQEPITIYNIIAFVTIVPVFFLFYTCNIAATTGAGGRPFGLHIPLNEFNWKSILILLLFYMLQFGVYVLLVYREFQGDSLFRFMTACMCVVPLFKLGTMGDFCWNVSVPFFFLLMMYCIKYIFLHVHIEKTGQDTTLKVKKPIIGIAFCLSLSLLNPMSQIGFGFKIAYQEKTFNLMCRGVVDTFANKTMDDLYMINYLVPNYEQTTFFKYIAK